MTTGPRSEVGVGERVEIRRLKWPSALHREQNSELIAHDKFGHWFDVPPGVDTTSKPGWEFSHKHRAVLLIPNSGWWTSYWSGHGSIYVDITTPPKWTTRTSIETTDLALDLYVSPSDEVSTLDMDEYLLESPSWPAHLAIGAMSELQWLQRSLKTDDVWKEGWTHLSRPE